MKENIICELLDFTVLYLLVYGLHCDSTLQSFSIVLVCDHFMGIVWRDYCVYIVFVVMVWRYFLPRCIVVLFGECMIVILRDMLLYVH